AGTYRARLDERHNEDRFGDAVGAIDGWICSRSEEFAIRVLPHPIALPKGDRRRLRERFDAIDFTKPPLIVLEPRRVADGFSVPIASPEDELYRAGWTAVPVLLDVLDDGPATFDAQTWALALLWDVTGLHGPDELDHSPVDPWAAPKHPTRWPTV